MKPPTAIQRNSRALTWVPNLQFWSATVFILCCQFALTDHLFAQSGQSKGLQNARVKLVNGSSIRATINSISKSGLVSGSRLLEGTRLDEITSIETGRDAKPVIDRPVINLKSGGKQPFDTLTIANESLSAELGTDTNSFPLELIESIVFSPSQKLNQVLHDRNADTDYVIVRTSSGERVVRGLLESIDTTHLFLNYNGKSRKIALEKILSVVLAKLAVDRANGTLAKVSLANGAHFAGAVKELDEQGLKLGLSANFEISIPLDQLSTIVIDSDRVVYLSDLSPIRFEQQTQFAAARTWQRDRSLLGNPLRLKIRTSNRVLTFEKGIGTRSYTSLTFANEKFDTLRAVVGIDVETSGNGDCELVISGDGIRLWSRRVRGTDDPETIKVDIKGIEEVTLAVFPGEKFDLADHVNWADARFTKK